MSSCSTTWTSKGYSVGIDGATVTDDNYVVIDSETKNIVLRISSSNSEDADIEIFMQGKSQGCWRLRKFSMIVLKRPAEQNRAWSIVDMIEPNPGFKQGSARNGAITIKFFKARSKPYAVLPPGYVTKSSGLTRGGGDMCLAGSAGLEPKSSGVARGGSSQTFGEAAIGYGHKTNQSFVDAAYLDVVETPTAVCNLRVVLQKHIVDPIVYESESDDDIELPMPPPV